MADGEHLGVVFSLALCLYHRLDQATGDAGLRLCDLRLQGRGKPNAFVYFARILRCRFALWRLLEWNRGNIALRA